MGTLIKLNNHSTAKTTDKYIKKGVIMKILITALAYTVVALALTFTAFWLIDAIIGFVRG